MKFPTFLIVTISAISIAKSQEPDVTALEQGYKAAAEALTQELTEEAKKPEVSGAVLANLYKASETMNDVSRRMARAINKPPSTPGVPPARLQVESVSNRPPSLKQNPQDLYDRFKSFVIVRVALLGAKGENSMFQPVEVMFGEAKPDQ